MSIHPAAVSSPLRRLPRWLRFTWLGRIPLLERWRLWLRERRTAAESARRRRPVTLELERCSDRVTPNDMFSLLAVPLGAGGLALGRGLQSPMAVLQDGWLGTGESGGTPTLIPPATSRSAPAAAPPDEAVLASLFSAWQHSQGAPQDGLAATPTAATQTSQADSGDRTDSFANPFAPFLDDGQQAAGRDKKQLPPGGLGTGGGGGGGGGDSLPAGTVHSSIPSFHQPSTGQALDPVTASGMSQGTGTPTQTSAGTAGTAGGGTGTTAAQPMAATAVVTAPGGTSTTVPDASTVLQGYGQATLPFEVNVGQTDSSVNFLSHGPGFQLFLTPSGATFTVPVAGQNGGATQDAGAGQDAGTTQDTTTAAPAQQESFAFQLAGANASPTIKGDNLLPSRSNYYVGSDPSQWHTDVENYGKVEYDGVYNGINLVYDSASGRQLEYTFQVQPGADPSAIKMNWQGVLSESIDSSGNIDLQTAGGTIVIDAPSVYQEVNGAKQTVTVQQVQTGVNQTGFQLGSYDPTKPLIIDPTLSYSSYLGGSGADYGYGVAVDGAGDAYVTGQTASTNFPTTLGFGTAPGTDAFVTKLNGTGSGIVYSDYLGGTTNSQGNAIAVDLAGNAYVTGFTNSTMSGTSFPTTTGAYQTSIANPGASSVFVSKLSAAGDVLDYSTLLGNTSLTGQGNGIAVNARGEAFVTGTASSSVVSDPFPTTPGAFQTAPSAANQNDAFVTKLKADGSSLAYSTYLGGAGNDQGNAIAIDLQGDAYVTGSTASSAFPTQNPFQSSLSGTQDAFVTELNTTGSSLVYASYLGGSGSETGYGIAVDRAGSAYLTGQTTSSNFPTKGPLQSSLSGTQDAFVSKVSADGSTLTYSTYLGGGSTETGYGIAVDSSGAAFVTGSTGSTNFPTTSGAYQTSHSGTGTNAFLSKLSASGNTLTYSTYLGGTGGTDVGRGVAVDLLGNAYLAGYTNSTNFPTVSPEQSSNAGGYDAFIAKLLAGPAAPVFTGITPDTGSSSSDQDTSSQSISLLGTAAANATVTLYREGVGLIGTTTASASGLWTFTYSTTLPEGVAAFYATALVSGVSSLPTADYLVTVDLTAPTVNVTVPATTPSLAPQVRVTGSDLNGLPNGTTVTLDVDLNNNGNFTDTGETGYATGTLTDGLVVITLYNASHPLSVGSTYRVQARVSDKAGNQGTSSASSFQVTTVTSPWTPTGQALSSDPLSGDAQDQLGDMSLSHPLDLDQSPGTAQSGDAQLVYNSDWVNAKPVVQVTLPSDNSQALPSTIDARLTFNGVAGATVTYSTSGFHPGDVLALSQQASSAITTSGRYAWSMTIKVNYATPQTYTVSGIAYVVSEDASAFGSGWTLSTVDQLIPIAADANGPAGVLRVYGNGGWSFYASAGGNNYTSPTGDNGTLTGNSTSGWTYTMPDGQSTAFNASGQETSWTSPDGQETLQYRWTGSQLTGMTAIDGALATFTYTGGLLSSIQATNSRTWTLSNGGSGTNLTSITDPDGGIRTLTYDTSHRLTADNFAGLQNEYAYSSSGGLASMTYGSTTGPGGVSNTDVSTYAPAISQGLTTLVLGPVWASQTNADSHKGQVQLDSSGRIVQRLNPDGGLTQDVYTNGYLTSETDPLGNTTTYTRDSQGYVTTVTYADLSTERSQYQTAFHALTTYTDARGNSTTYSYDPTTGHLLSETDALGDTTSYGYLTNGLLQTVTTPRGYTTSYAYDTYRRLITTTDPLNDVTSLSYDANGNLSTTTDANNNVTTTVYDVMGRLTNTITPLGFRTTTVYTKAGLETSSTDPNGNVTSMVYDGYGRGQLVQTMEAYGSPVQASTLESYDPAGLSQGSRDADGWWTTSNTYDPNGQLLQAANALGGVTMSQYDLAGRQIASRNELGAWTKQVYNSRGWVVQQIDALGGVTSNSYDANGNLTSSTDPLGNTTSTVYDKLNRVSVSYDDLGNATTTTYDKDGNTASVTDANNVTTSYGYDALDRQTSVTEAVGTALQRTTSTGYDKVGNVITQTDALGRTTTTAYDQDNRAVTVTNALNETTVTGYDSGDRVVKQTDALGKVTTLVYNQLNQQTATTDPLGHTSNVVDDGDGQQVGGIDPAGDVSQDVYDPLGRQVASADGNGDLTQTRYDSAGDTSAVIDPVNNMTSYVTDALGRVVRTTDAAGGVGTATFDANGRMTAQTDADGRSITFSYDKNGNETGETWFNSSGSVVNRVTMTYDNNGNLKTAANNAGTITMSYDQENRLSAKTDVHGVTLTYSYDKLDHVTGLQDSLGGLETSVYNQAGELTSRQFSAAGQVARLDPGYNSRDEMTSQTRYSDLAGTQVVGTASYSIDDAGRLTSIVNKNSSGATLAYENYGYDTASRLSTESWWSQVGTTVYSGNHTYSYDLASQLVGDGTKNYSYDPNGNRTMTGYQTGTNNRLTTDGTWTYTYDQAGNEVQKSKGSGLETWYFGYDNENHLTSIQQTSNGTTVLLAVSYVYDALGDRVEQDKWTSGTGTVVTRFAFDGQNVIADTDASNNVLSRYVYGDGTDQIWARLVPTGQSNPGVYYYLTDHLGSVRDIMSSSQSLVDHIDYDAYGNPTESNPSYGSRYMYTGREYDAQTGLQYNRARYYDPSTGRWLSEDPSGLGPDTNSYRYSDNNSINSSDPSGFEPPVTLPTKLIPQGNFELVVKGVPIDWTQQVPKARHINTRRYKGDINIYTGPIYKDENKKTWSTGGIMFGYTGEAASGINLMQFGYGEIQYKADKNDKHWRYVDTKMRLAIRGGTEVRTSDGVRKEWFVDSLSKTDPYYLNENATIWATYITPHGTFDPRYGYLPGTVATTDFPEIGPLLAQALQENGGKLRDKAAEAKARLHFITLFMDESNIIAYFSWDANATWSKDNPKKIIIDTPTDVSVHRGGITRSTLKTFNSVLVKSYPAFVKGDADWMKNEEPLDEQED